MAPPLDKTALSALDDVGFVVVPGVFRAHEVAEMRAAFDRLVSAARSLPSAGMHQGAQFVLDPDPFRLHRVVWCGAAESALSRYGRDPRLLALASFALQSRAMEQLINQAHFKLPGDDVVFDWHQDSRHRRYGTPLWRDVNGRGSFVETVTAIDPMTEENGPLRIVPGSQRLGHIEPLPGTDQLPPGAFDLSEAVTLTLEPGDVALFGPYLVHGSGPNRGPGPRRLFLNGFCVPGANDRVYPGEGAGRALRYEGL